MQNTATGDQPCPWGQPTAGDMYTTDTVTYPFVPPVTTDAPVNVGVTWPNTPEPIPGTEEFHDFMCWLAGFTDPDNPPSQERWEAFQRKVREMAAEFWEYKKEQRAREFNTPFTLTANANEISGTGISAGQTQTYAELSTF
jgi:hypothetical protein